MSIILQQELPLFDTKKLCRGCAIRVRHASGTIERMGLVHKVTPFTLTLLYSNIQNAAVSYYDITALDVANGEWSVSWTRDMETIHREGQEEQLPASPEGGA